ncbi:MAG: glycosyltransferase family 2 protein [bacterium]|nr:glycosyltransferase family 2 protein [bacterium]
MNITLHTVGFLLFFHGVYQLIKYLIVIPEIKNNFLNTAVAVKNYLKKTHKISVLVPVLHEEKTIEKFLTDLSRQDYPNDCYEVYAVTTQKEYLKNIEPNTIDILKRIISENKFPKLRLTIIHYPGLDGFKTHQLDFAFNQIRKNIGDVAVSESFFIFFDADSEVDVNTLTRFNNSIENGTEIYQQPLLWFKNIDVLKSSLMQSFAFLQSFFSISYEIPMFIGKFCPWRLKYFVGHGLCMRGSFIIRVGGFPDIIEDVRFGRLSSFLNIKVKLVSGFGIVETAKNLSVYIKQSSIWFFGCGLFISDYLCAQSLRKTKSITLKDFVLISYGFFKAFRWLNKGLLHLVGLIFSFAYMSIPLFVLFSSSLLLNSTIPVLLVSKDFKEIWWKKLNSYNGIIVLFRSILFSPILFMFNFIGLYYGLYKLLKFYLWGHITLPKTER